MGIEGDLLWALKRHLFKVSCGFPAITRRRLMLIVRQNKDDIRLALRKTALRQIREAYHANE
jgi:hypothetical protein